MRTIICLFICLTICLTYSQGYRMLGIFAFQGKSHFIMFEALMKGLVNKGHQVDVVSTFPLKKPYENYTDLVVLPTPTTLVNNVTYQFMTNSLSKGMVVRTVSLLAGNDLCENLAHPKIQKLIRDASKGKHYDAVIIEVFGAPCFAIFGHLFKVPTIGVSTAALYPWINHHIGNPENLAFVPNNLFNYIEQMNFWQRTYNVIYTSFNKMYFNYITKYQDEQIKKYVGPNMPSIREMETKVSIILVNTYFSLNGPKPMTPALIEVGGLHVQDDGSKLSPELKKLLDDSKDGFIYFTFGSMIRIETFPKHILDIFYKSMEKIAPINVIMKITQPKELPPGLPKNVHVFPWLSQLKILQHPNVKAFITHGGLMGTQEAIACGVPMIGIPLFADQFINIDSYVHKNIAIKLDHEHLTQKDMDDALHKILYNSTYRETARMLGKRFIDRPLKPIDTANYWIEYIIKYGENSLRSPAMDLTWWEIALLDVYAFISIVIFIIIYITIRSILFISNIIFNMDNKIPYKKKNV